MNGSLLTARAVATLLDVSPATVLRWTRRGDLPAIRLPSGAVRYSEDRLGEWLDQHATPVAAARPPALSSVTPATANDEGC